MCAKFKKKWFCWDFEVLPPDFVTINQNFSPIPQIYTPSTTILTEKNFWEVSQFSRKTYIVCKIWTKMVLVRIWSVTPWLSDSQSKFQSYSTNLHLQHYHSDNKEFLENFPIFQKNLHCLPNRYQIDSKFHIQFHIRRLNLLQDYLLLFGNFTPIPQICTHRATNLEKNIFEEISQFSRKTYIVCKIWKKMILLGFWSLTQCFVTINQNSCPIPQIYTPNTTNLTEKNFGKFLSFPEKLTLCAKFEQKWFCWDFEVLPPDFVRINKNFSPIPQIQTQNTTNLTKNNFWKVSQFSRKTYIVCKIWTKMVLLGFWSLTPWFCDNQSKFQSYSTNLHIKHYHSDLKEFLESFPIFHKNLQCLQNLDKNGFG